MDYNLGFWTSAERFKLKTQTQGIISIQFITEALDEDKIIQEKKIFSLILQSAYDIQKKIIPKP